MNDIEIGRESKEWSNKWRGSYLFEDSSVSLSDSLMRIWVRKQTLEDNFREVLTKKKVWIDGNGIDLEK